jgi:hypothetical protein
MDDKPRLETISKGQSYNQILTHFQGLYSQHFIFFVTYEWSQKLEYLSLASLSSLV